MTFGIMVYEYFGNYGLLRVYDDSRYDEMRVSLRVCGMRFVGGRKGMPEAEIVDFSRRAFEAIGRGSEDRAISLEAELKQVFK